MAPAPMGTPALARGTPPRSTLEATRASCAIPPSRGAAFWRLGARSVARWRGWDKPQLRPQAGWPAVGLVRVRLESRSQDSWVLLLTLSCKAQVINPSLPGLELIASRILVSRGWGRQPNLHNDTLQQRSVLSHVRGLLFWC